MNTEFEWLEGGSVTSPQGYRACGVAAGIKEKSLYQLALMYLSPANARADRDKAIGYLRQQLALFPDGELADKAVRRLDQALNLND